MVSLGLKDAYLQVPMHPDSRKFLRFMVGGEGVPVQGTLLRPFHGSASFYQGHGSCVSDSTQDGGTTSSLPGRLVASGILTLAAWYLLGVILRTQCFQGFSCPEEIREASLHWRRILVLRQSASVILAGVIRGAVLKDQLVPGGRLRMRSLQLTLRRQWDRHRSVSAGRVVAGNPRRSFLVA